MPKTIKEKKAANVNEGIKGVELLYTSAFFVFLSNVSGNLKAIFLASSDYFQATSFVLRGFLFLFMTARYALSPNKNAGKLGNWLLGALQLVLAGLATFGAVTLGAAAMTGIFLAMMAVDALINLGKAIYFFISSEINEDAAQRNLLREKGMKAAIGLVLSGLVAAVVVLMFLAAPYIGLTAVAALGVSAGIVLAGIALVSIVAAIHKTFFSDATKEEVLIKKKNANPSNTTYAKLDSLLSTTSEETKREVYDALNATPEPTKREGYYAHNIVVVHSPEEIHGSILAHKMELIRKIRADRESNALFLPEQEKKRKNKIDALEILEDLLVQIEKKELCSKGKITLDNKEFEYETTDQLRQQLNDYIIEKFPGVYQSFHHEIGKTEYLFSQVFALLKDTAYVTFVPEPPKEILSEVEQAPSKSELGKVGIKGF